MKREEKREEQKIKPKPGDKVTILLEDGQAYTGTWMPRPEILGEDKVILKLHSGYNIGIDKKRIRELKITEQYAFKEKKGSAVPQQKGAKKITILHTGGTIASQVDYNTGAVVARFEPQEFLQLFPELQTIAAIDSKLVFQMFSEDMEPEHWKKLAEAVEQEYKAGAAGIIITHGTDIIHYTAAALSFMLQNLPIPVLIVGSQRSPDRGSSDAYLNMLHAVRFLAETDFAGVGVCMHGSTNDDFSLVHLGTKTRKMHTSRRDTFQSINTLPLAKITKENVTMLQTDYKKQKEVNGKFHILGKFSKKVGLIKIRPGINKDEVAFYLEKGYEGLIIEGTGLGHAPVNENDAFSKHHPELLQLLKKMSEQMIIVMCSQCIYGRVDMQVYSTGRYLLAAGIMSGEDMTSETAYVKLGWLLGNYSPQQARQMIGKDIAGEITERTHIQ